MSIQKAVVFLGISCISLFSQHPAYSLDIKNIRDLARNSTVGITSEKSRHGTGFMIEKRNETCIIATAGHNFDDSKSYRIQIENDKVYNSSKIYKDKVLDIGFIEVELEDKSQCVVNKFGDSKLLSLGQKVHFAAKAKFPNTSIRELIFTENKSIASIFGRTGKGGIEWMTTEIPSISGTSGAPMYDENGDVIGMAVQTALDDSGLVLTYSVPSNTIKNAITKAEFIDVSTVKKKETTPIKSKVIKSKGKPSIINQKSVKKSVPIVKQPQAPIKVNINSLRRTRIDIFYSQHRDILKNSSFTVKELLKKYSIHNVIVRPYNVRVARNLKVCNWSQIRYDPQEYNDAVLLRNIIETAYPNSSFQLRELNPTRDTGPTANYISIFIEDGKSYQRIVNGNEVKGYFCF